MTEEPKPPEEATSRQEAAQAAAQEAAESARAEAAAPPVDVFTVVRTCIALLDNQAWQAMGLRPDPMTGAIVKDLEQARIAIDSIAVLLDRIQGHLKEPEARELATLLTNLRLNFVRQE